MKLTRRDVAKGICTATATLGIKGAPALALPMPLDFPKGFVWGCATAAYQIEGAVNEDGRGRSIWDDFSHTPGKIANDANGDVACDSYHRYREDTGLLRNLGARAYRFSIAWPRIFPEGRGQPNVRGVDHYKRLIDNLLENGVAPYVTLFHWDLPSALPGGWQSRDTAKAFADYAGYMAAQLSDRVGHFMTTNELRSFVDIGYAQGRHAPGLKLAGKELAQVRHHALLAHGLGVAAIRAAAGSKIEVGLAENPAVPTPVIETEEHIAAARTAMRDLNGGYLTPIMEGAYPDSYLHGLGGHAPEVQAGDMRAIGSPLDFVALNYYTQVYVRAAADNSRGFAVVPPPASFPKMVVPWLSVGPEGIYWAIRLASELWKPKSIYISENGCPSADHLVNGRDDDSDRLMFLRNYMTHLHRAAADGYPIHGYFLWSLLDNFEWADGYTTRFGIHYTDYATQARTPKLSAAWYRELIRRNGLV